MIEIMTISNSDNLYLIFVVTTSIIVISNYSKTVLYFTFIFCEKNIDR